MGFYMSPLHIFVTTLIGILMGCIADILALQRVPGGAKGFIIVGVVGAFTFNLLCRLLANLSILPYIMSARPIIVLEDIVGAFLGVYLFSSIKWDI